MMLFKGSSAFLETIASTLVKSDLRDAVVDEICSSSSDDKYIYELPAVLGHFVTETEPDECHLLVFTAQVIVDVPFVSSDGRTCSVRPSSFVCLILYLLGTSSCSLQHLLKMAGYTVDSKCSMDC